MPLEPGELIDRMFIAYNEGGPTGFSDFLVREDAMHPEFVVAVHPDLIANAGEWHGIKGFEEMSRLWMEVWDEFELDHHETIEMGPGRHMVLVHQRGVAKGSGMEIGGDFFYTIRFEDGRVRAIGLFGDRGQAEAALAGG